MIKTLCRALPTPAMDAEADGYCPAATGTERWKQIELLDRVYFGITDLTQSRERVQAQITALEEQLAKLEQQIGKARQFGREDLAQEALTRLNSGQSQIATLKSQLDQLLAQRVKLTAAARCQARNAPGRQCPQGAVMGLGFSGVRGIGGPCGGFGPPEGWAGRPPPRAGCFRVAGGTRSANRLVWVLWD
jgi:hypothetical protein